MKSRRLWHSSCWPGLRSTPKNVSATTSPWRIESEPEGLGNCLGKTRGVLRKLLNVFPLQKRTPFPTASFAHCQAAGFSRYGFYILKNMLSGFKRCLGLRICCLDLAISCADYLSYAAGFISYAVRLYIMLCGFKNMLSGFKIMLFGFKRCCVALKICC